MAAIYDLPALPLDPDGFEQGRRSQLSELQDAVVTLQRHDMVIAQLLRRSSADAAALRRRTLLDIDAALADFSNAMSAARASYASTEELSAIEETLDRRLRTIETAAAHAQCLLARALERVLASASPSHLRQHQE